MLRDFPQSLAEAEKADLLATIVDESERLNRFIANLLDMTRLESGAVVPNAAPHDLAESRDPFSQPVRLEQLARRACARTIIQTTMVRS